MHKYPTQNTKISIHGVTDIVVTDIERDINGKLTIWRDVMILNDDNEIFEITLFSRTNNKNDLQVRFKESISCGWWPKESEESEEKAD